MSAIETPVSDEERRKKSVYYEACTSTFKDDFPTLVKCLRSPEPGNPHTRQEAGFLLWHHALEGDDVGGLLSAGLITACIANLDSPELLPADKACSAGILLALVCGDEDAAEQLVRAKGLSGRTALEVLHAVLHEDAALARQHCSRLLQALAQQAAPAVLRAMDNQLPYFNIYMELWGVKEHRDATAVAAVMEAVDLLLEQRLDLASSIVEAGGVEALLDVVRSHKSEAAVGAALNCLSKLLPQEPAMQQLISSGGLELLVDVLGPPPRAALENRPERIEDESTMASTPRTTWRLSLSAASLSAGAAAAAAAAAAARRASYNDEEAVDGDEAVNLVEEAADGELTDVDIAVAVTVSPLNPDPELDATPRSGSYERFSGASPRYLSKGGDSPPGSPTGMAKATGDQSGGSGWTSARTSRSHRSMGPYGSTSVQVRVPLPLVIPGIHSASPAASAAALMGSPSLHSQASYRALRLSTVQSTDTSIAILTGDGAADVTEGNGAQADGSGTAAAAAEVPPPLPTAADLCTNRSGLRWILLPGLEVAARAAACLTQLMQRPECQLAAELRLVSHRIVAQIKAVLGPKTGAEGGGSGKKKGKKKGLSLTSEQTAALTRLLGMLKFLALHNTTRYRIAKLGAVPILVRLYNDGNDYLLRNHCQAILSHVALLAENGAALQEAKMPEEFLVTNPMRLTSYERAVLRIEFPDDPAMSQR